MKKRAQALWYERGVSKRAPLYGELIEVTRATSVWLTTFNDRLSAE